MADESSPYCLANKASSFAPAANKKAPILAAIPMHNVLTSGLMKFIVSNIARPDVSSGELMYNEMSLSGFSDSKNNI